MSGLYGRPTAAELIAAVADFLDNEVRGAIEGPVNFHARVAANVLRIVERELLDGPADDVAAALGGLGYADEDEFAMAIRAGDLDDRPDDVLAALRTIVRRRLDVAHPGYAE
jgi:AcrR family transcriptional regulator